MFESAKCEKILYIIILFKEKETTLFKLYLYKELGKDLDYHPRSLIFNLENLWNLGFSEKVDKWFYVEITKSQLLKCEIKDLKLSENYSQNKYNWRGVLFNLIYN